MQERGVVAALTSGAGSTEPGAPRPAAASRTRWYVVSVVVALMLGLAVWRLRLSAPALPFPRGRGKLVGGGLRSAWKLLRSSLPSVPEWSRFLLWGAFGIAVFNVLTRP